MLDTGKMKDATFLKLATKNAEHQLSLAKLMLSLDIPDKAQKALCSHLQAYNDWCINFIQTEATVAFPDIP